MNPFEEIGVDQVETAKSELFTILESTGGTLRLAQARAIADIAGVTERTVWNWARQIRPDVDPVEDNRNFMERVINDGPRGFIFDDLAAAMVYAVGGNLRRFWEDCIEVFGQDRMPSYSQVTRLWSKVHPMVKAGAKSGLKHRSKHCLYLQHFAGGPNEAWQLDEFILDIEVFAPRSGQRTVSPRLLLLVDVWDRSVVGWAVLPKEPTAVDVAALIADAMHMRTDDVTGASLGGRPGLILFDNAKAFTADYVTDALVELGAIGRAVTPYMPTAKGVVERTGKTVQQMVVTGVAGVKTQAESWSKQDLFGAKTVNLVTWNDIVEHIGRRIDTYNRSHTHAATGMTPLAQRATWNASLTPVPESAIGQFWLQPERSGTRKVEPQGVMAFGQKWTDPALDPYIGKNADVRAPHHRRDCVAVFVDDLFVCMAMPQQELDSATRSQVLATRNKHIREVNHLAKAARTIQAEQARMIADGEEQQVVQATISALGAARAGNENGAADAEAAGPGEHADAPEERNETELDEDSQLDEVERADSRARPTKRPPKRAKRGDALPDAPTGAVDRRKRARDIARQSLDVDSNETDSKEGTS